MTSENVTVNQQPVAIESINQSAIWILIIPTLGMRVHSSTGVSLGTSLVPNLQTYDYGWVCYIAIFRFFGKRKNGVNLKVI